MVQEGSEGKRRITAVAGWEIGLVGSEVKWEKGGNVRFAARHKCKIAEIKSCIYFLNKTPSNCFRSFSENHCRLIP